MSKVELTSAALNPHTTFHVGAKFDSFFYKIPSLLRRQSNKESHVRKCVTAENTGGKFYTEKEGS